VAVGSAGSGGNTRPSGRWDTRRKYAEVVVIDGIGKPSGEQSGASEGKGVAQRKRHVSRGSKVYRDAKRVRQKCPCRGKRRLLRQAREAVGPSVVPQGVCRPF